MKPALETIEHREGLPILIVDKNGLIGAALAIEFAKDFLVVFASDNFSLRSVKNVIHVPFKGKYPKIPDNLYLKIFIVDDKSKITKESISSFIKVARGNDASLFFITGIREKDAETAEDFISSYSKGKVLIFGDLFDKEIFFDKEGSIDKFILQARKTKKILVSGSGLSLNFPISFKYTINLIVKASYLNFSEKSILLFYPHPVTDISLAHIFQKINPYIKVDFIKRKNERKIYIPGNSLHVVAEYDLEKQIKNLDIESLENREIKIATNDSGKNSRFLKPFIFFATILVFLLTLPFITTLAYSVLGYREIGSASFQAEKGDLEKSLKHANNSKTFFEIAEKTSIPLIAELRIVGFEKNGEETRSKINTGKDLSSAALYLIQGIKTLSEIYSGEGADPKEDFQKASLSFKTSLNLLQKTKAQGNLPKDFEKRLENIGPFIDLFSNSSDILPGILGFDEEMNYLVLFQDNTRIRPGGGFISSYGLLKIKDAKVLDFSIHDVGKSDAKLRTHIEPPFAIRRYLPSADFYLKDSNFDPDFVNSAISAATIYSLSEKKKVDGVIGIDYLFAKNLLSLTGDTSVDSNKKVNENNLFKVAAEISHQKKDLLSILIKSIADGKYVNKDISYFALSEMVGKSINEKHLIFAFQDAGFQNVFTANNWSASLWDERREQDSRINDYLGITEANLLLNNVNPFISKSVSKKTIVSASGRVSSKLTIAYKNNSKTTEGSAEYKNYLQIVLPEGSSIKSVFVDNKEVKTTKAITDFFVYELKTFKPPKELEIEERREMNKSIFGLLLNVSPGQIKTLTISYDLPYSISKSEKSVQYSLKFFKQPGIDSYPFDLTFSLPDNYEIVGEPESFSGEVIKDQDFSFIIAQK